jgi:two-component system, OmpR family, response regulator VicR
LQEECILEAKVLIVEDDKEIANLVSFYLKPEGFETKCCETGEDALACASEGWDVVLLDVWLSKEGRNGFEVCEELRNQNIDIPIIFVTARDQIMDKKLGLETVGGTHYITKPIDFIELVATIKSSIRNYRMVKGNWNQTSEEKIQNSSFGVLKFEVAEDQLEIDTEAGIVTLNGETIELTALEYKLLCYMTRNAGKILTKAHLIENVWKRDDSDFYRSAIDDKRINTMFSRLREKIGDDSQKSRYIQTVRGVGYRFIKQ